MNEQPKPQPTALTDNEKIIEVLREQNIWLKKLNEKFAFFLILLIVGWLVTRIF